MPPIHEQFTQDELKSDPVFKNFETIDDLGKAYREARVAVSRKGVILPPEGAKDEDWAPVFDALGRPKEPKEYELPQLQLPNGMKLDMAEIEEFQKTAHAMGMTKKQFQKAIGYRIDKLVKEQTALAQKQKEERDAAETSLRQMFGAKYDERISGIQKLVNAFGEGATQEDINEVLKRPGLIRMLSGVLDNLSEASLENMGHVKSDAMTPEEAQAEIHAIRTEKANQWFEVYNDPRHPKTPELKKHMEKLYKMAYPSAKKI